MKIDHRHPSPGLAAMNAAHDRLVRMPNPCSPTPREMAREDRRFELIEDERRALAEERIAEELDA